MLILPAATWREARDTWRLADEMGFAHAWTYDHIAWRDLAGQEWYSALPVLAAAAQCTSRLTLGTLVCTPNFRHPVSLAKDAVTLGDVSGGRFALGLGAGAGGLDARVLGGPQLTPSVRAARFAEFVALTAGLLRGDVTDFSGDFYRVREAYIDPAGRAATGITLAVAASGPRGIRVAARHADIWVTNGSSPAPGVVAPAADVPLVRQQISELHRACQELSRDQRGLRVLLLNVNRENPPLRSIETFVDTIEGYGEIGVTDLVVPFPRPTPPFVAELSVMERIASEVLPRLSSTGDGGVD